VRKWLKVVVGIVASLALVAAVGVFFFFRALHHVPEFYQEALRGDPVKQKAAGHEMHLRTVELASHVQVAGRWQQAFTAEQINGWLAVGRNERPEKDELAEARDLIPATVIDPRVVIAPDGITIACRFDTGSAGQTVLSLTVDAYLTEENEIALRIRRARAGAIPAPLDVVFKHLSDALAQAKCPARASQVDGDPVVLISLPPVGKHDELTVRLDTLRLSDGKIEVAGTTKRR
jgi:hypothetical protein